jgi:hypothetical protein
LGTENILGESQGCGGDCGGALDELSASFIHSGKWGLGVFLMIQSMGWPIDD